MKPVTPITIQTTSTRTRWIFTAFLLLIFLGIVYAMTTRDALNPKDSVFAYSSSTNAWYAGTVQQSCEGGFFIETTSSTINGCFHFSELIKDRKPTKISIGDKVLVIQQDHTFENGQVIDKKNGNYTVKFFDNRQIQTDIDHLRADVRASG